MATTQPYQPGYSRTVICIGYLSQARLIGVEDVAGDEDILKTVLYASEVIGVDVEAERLYEKDC
jgi:hypothetical protein